jgi:hypothetical protein
MEAEDMRRRMAASPEWSSQPELSGAVQKEIMSTAIARANALRRTGPQGQDPNQIFDPNSKEYAFEPNQLRSIAAGVRARDSAAMTTKVTSKDDPNYIALPPGAHYIGPDGVLSIKQAPPKPAPAAQHATAADIAAGYISPIQGRGAGGGYTIDAPARSQIHVLNGKRFATREEAATAIQNFYNPPKVD